MNASRPIITCLFVLVFLFCVVGCWLSLPWNFVARCASLKCFCRRYRKSIITLTFPSVSSRSKQSLSNGRHHASQTISRERFDIESMPTMICIDHGPVSFKSRIHPITNTQTSLCSRWLVGIGSLAILCKYCEARIRARRV